MSSGAVNEAALTLDCDGETLVAVLHQPAVPSDVGVVVIVGGLTFFPALALGPVVDHLFMIAGRTL